MRKYIIKKGRKHRKKAFLLVVMLFCMGCGQPSSSKIPQLQEPIIANTAYRPVEYGSIGREVLSGTVVPEDYCHYYDANVTISEMMVNVGDMVEAGDILAYADVEAAEESLKEYQAQLSYENTSYEWNQQISQIKLEKLEYQKMKQNANAENIPQINTENSTEDTTQINTENNTEDVPQINTENNTEPLSQPENMDDMQTLADTFIDYDTQSAVEKENARYDTMLHEYRIKKLQESITSLQKVIEEGALIARHNGQVTYTKNLAKGREAGANENIVVVSDLADTYIELTDTNIQEYSFSEYEVKYITIAGEKLPVTEKKYSTEEMILSKINQCFPNVRIQCPEGYTFQLGDTYPVYFAKKDIQNALIIGNDSLYTEGNEHYVYIKNDFGEREKRFIKIGEADENYTQVLEGLFEGEMVYYQSTAKMPSEYTEYTVTSSDFEINNYGDNYLNSESNAFSCSSDYDGEIIEIAVSPNQEVTEGDLLYVIETGEGKAAIAEAQNAIDQENISYQQNLSSINKQIETTNALAVSDGSMSYELQILDIQKELASLTHEHTLNELQKNYNQISNGNDGTGKVSIYAPVSGTVSKVNISVENKIEMGDEILQINPQSTDILLVQLTVAPIDTTVVHVDNIADVGETVIIQKGDTFYEGICVGWEVSDNNQRKGYVYTDEQGEAHLSHNGSSGYGCSSFYIKMNDSAFFEDKTDGKTVEFKYVSMHDVVVVPSSFIYSETDSLVKDKTAHYVWRVVNGELVKQYVVLNETWKDNGKQVIVSGISPGDVLAQE